MSYRTWTISGYGFNVSQITEDLRFSTDYDFIKTTFRAIDDMIQNVENTRNYVMESYPDTYAQIHDAVYDDDLLKEIDIEEIINEFNEYESSNFTTYGFDQLLIDALDYLWTKDNHDPIQTAAIDEFADNSVYWMLSTVYPWHRCEFASEQDCERTIKRCFGKIVEKSKFEILNIENGG